ncbi:MAG: hypothetical protein IJ068_01500 [Bacilli bacterium]|nr:hypothetical protein [Bacilli bacterium]
MIDMSQDEVNNTYYLVQNYLKKRESKEYLSDYDKLPPTDKLRVLACSRLLRKRAEAIITEITSDVIDLESDIGVLKGLNHRIKPFSSIVEKTVADSLDYNGSYERAANNINDLIRFTFVIPDNLYINNIDQCLHRLESMGYQVIEFKNKWNSKEFKGINVRLAAKNNEDVFEIQFHTPLAYKIKEGDDPESKKHSTRSLYQVSRDESAPVWLRLKADKLRMYLQQFIEVPEGAIEYTYDPEIRRVK